MDPRKSVSEEVKSTEEKILHSPLVETKEGHRFIPDDTHKPQGVTDTQSFFPWHTKQKNPSTIKAEPDFFNASSNRKNAAGHC